MLSPIFEYLAMTGTPISADELFSTLAVEKSHRKTDSFIPAAEKLVTAKTVESIGPKEKKVRVKAVLRTSLDILLDEYDPKTNLRYSRRDLSATPCWRCKGRGCINCDPIPPQVPVMIAPNLVVWVTPKEAV